MIKCLKLWNADRSGFLVQHEPADDHRLAVPGDNPVLKGSLGDHRGVHRIGNGDRDGTDGGYLLAHVRPDLLFYSVVLSKKVGDIDEKVTDRVVWGDARKKA